MRAALLALALIVASASEALACSIERASPRELRAEQARDLRGSDLIFLARVIGHGTSDDPEFNVVQYQPITRVLGSGEPPEYLSIASFECFPLPPIGETHVILMRSADLSGTPDRTSPVLGAYAISDILLTSLRQRAEWALQRANVR